MKLTKLFLTTLPLLLISVLSYGQQVEKTLVKAFNLQGLQEVVLNLDGIVEVTPWENDIMRIQMQISLDGSNTMLKNMVQTGRYRLLSKTNEEKFVVFAPGTDKGLNKNIGEKIVYKIFVPNYVQVQVQDEVMSSKEKSDTDSSKL